MANSMKSKKRLSLAFFLMCLVALSAISQTTKSDRLGRPIWITTPKDIVNDSSSASSEIGFRKARDDFFNVPGAPPLISHDPSDKSFPSGGRFDTEVTRDPLPSQISDVVVIANVLAFQPFLSSDKSTVYSELTAIPLDIVKDDKSLLPPGAKFIILQRGGTLREQAGKVVNSVPYGGANPVRLDTRCLLFLQYHAKENAFTVIRIWDLSGEKPREMDDDGHPYQGRRLLEDKLSSETALKAYVKLQR